MRKNFQESGTEASQCDDKFFFMLMPMSNLGRCFQFDLMCAYKSPLVILWSITMHRISNENNQSPLKLSRFPKLRTLLLFGDGRKFYPRNHCTATTRLPTCSRAIRSL